MVLCKVQLLDGTDYDAEIDKQSKGQVLLDLLCQRVGVTEKDYFGFTFKDSKNNRIWLNLEKRIAKQIASESWVFSFVIKFYPPDPFSLQDEATRYQLFLQLRTDILSGRLPCSFVTHALLGSYAVQSQLGDFDPAEHGTGFQYLKDVSFAPNQSHELLEKIAELHRTHKGQMPSDAEAHYLDNACKLSMYGVHLYPAKDDDGSSVQVGVCAAGMLIYKERLRINRFTWPKILKISYKRNIFTIKLRPGEFEQMETTVEYKLANYEMAKRLWKICIEHHAFFRLREVDPPPRGLFSRFGPKHHFAGRTQYQTQQTASGLNNQQTDVKRIVGRRFVGSKSMETVVVGYSTERSEQYQQDEQRTATLDIRGRRQGSLPLLDASNLDQNYDNSDRCVPDFERSSRTSGGDYTVDHDDSAVLGSNGSDTVYANYSKIGTSDARNQQQQQRSDPNWNGATSREGTLDRNAYGYGNNLPPCQDDHLMQQQYGYGGPSDTGWQPYGTDTSTVKTMTRTYTADDGTIITEHRTERDGIVETHIEKQQPDENYGNSFDYDKALSDAILAVTKVNIDLTVEKIEIETKDEEGQMKEELQTA